MRIKQGGMEVTREERALGRRNIKRGVKERGRRERKEERRAKGRN